MPNLNEVSDDEGVEYVLQIPYTLINDSCIWVNGTKGWLTTKLAHQASKLSPLLWFLTKVEEELNGMDCAGNVWNWEKSRTILR